MVIALITTCVQERDAGPLGFYKMKGMSIFVERLYSG